MTAASRFIAPLAVAASLCIGLPASSVRAQEPGQPPAEGEGSGRPLDGYLATAALAFLALFLVAKSARR